MNEMCGDLPFNVLPYCATSIDMLVPRGQLKDIYSASQPAFWYVLKVPASSAVNRENKQNRNDFALPWFSDKCSVDTLLLHAYRVIHSFSIGGCLSTFQIDIQIEYKTTCIQVNKFMMRKLRSLAFSPFFDRIVFCVHFLSRRWSSPFFSLAFPFTPPLSLSLSLYTSGVTQFRCADNFDTILRTILASDCVCYFLFLSCERLLFWT